MYLNIFLEVILVAILVGGSSYGYNKGLFKMAAAPVRLLLCISLSLSLSRAVGSSLIEPFILSRVKDSTIGHFYPAIEAISVVIAFLLLFFLLKIIFSLIISFATKIFDAGVLGKINKALGFVLASVIAILSAMCFTSITEYVFLQDTIRDSNILIGFSGGPLYSAFRQLSPLRLFFTN